MTKLKETKSARNGSDTESDKNNSDKEESPKQAKLAKGQKGNLKENPNSQPENKPRRGRGRPRKTPASDAGKFDAEMHST